MDDRSIKPDAELDDSQSAGPPRVFISYAYETPNHKRWVAQFATDLRQNGVDAILDQWEVQYGDDLTLFMERGIRDAARVLLVCTPAYARKSNEGEGGVGYERLVVTGEIAAKIDTNKFICVLRTGTRENSIPTFAKTRLFVDFCDDATYSVALEELLRDIHNTPRSPKPSVGTNPFKDSALAAISTRIETYVKSDATIDIEELYARAEHLLRDKDLLGWKRLVRSVRAELPTRLTGWRNACETKLRASNVSNDEWRQEIHNGCDYIAPVMLLALTAVDSEIESLIDQRGILDDLINLSQWNQAGYDLVVDAPPAFAYCYNSVLGSFLVANNHHSFAVDLLRTKVPVVRGSAETEGLWQSPELMGWLPTFGSNIQEGWRYLSEIWEKQPWLAHFFLRRDELMLGIRSYYLLGSFMDLSGYLARGGEQTLISSDRFSPGVPPLALAPWSNFGEFPPVAKAIALAAPRKSVVENIVTELGCPIDTFYNAWPAYFQAMLHMAERVFGLRRAYMTTQSVPQLP